LSAWKKPANLYSTKCRIFGPPPPRAQHRGGTPLPDGLFSTPSKNPGLPEHASPKLRPTSPKIFFKNKKIFFFYDGIGFLLWHYKYIIKKFLKF
jgi:hypothetical protein